MAFLGAPVNHTGASLGSGEKWFQYCDLGGCSEDVHKQ